MTESEILEPAVLDTIERYFDLLQAHVPAQMIGQVLAAYFETGQPTVTAGAARTGWPSSSTPGRCSSTSPTRCCS